MNFLIAEDESQKLDHLRDFVISTYPGSSVICAKSVRSAIDLLEAQLPEVVLLDMSLPTFDVAPGEPGGRPQGFGGREVLRYMDFLGLKAHVIVVTAYEGFEDESRSVDLTCLYRELRDDHPNLFRGIVYYSGLNSEWQKQLHDLIGDAQNGGVQ